MGRQCNRGRPSRPRRLCIRCDGSRARNWGGARSCSNHNHDDHAPLNDSQMSRAQDMWTRFQFFVRKYLRVAIMPHTDGKFYHKFEDVENTVWWKVATSVSTYRPMLAPTTGLDCPQAWLREIVFTVVADHFRWEYSQRRDVRKTYSLPEDKAGRGIVNPADPPPARPTPTAGALNRVRE